MLFLGLRIEKWDLKSEIKLPPLMGAYFATSAMRAACVLQFLCNYTRNIRELLEREREITF